MPLPRFLSRPASRLLRRVFSWFQRLDRRDPVWLRWLPSSLKGRIVRSLWRPVAARLADVHTLGGLEMRVPAPMRYMYVVREYEARTRQLLDRLLAPGRVAVDVGANIGFLTSWMARRVAPGGRVWAVEPEPANLSLLRENLSRNRLQDLVTVLPVAAGATEESLPLVLQGRGMGHSLHGGGGGVRSIQVPVRRLDDLITTAVDLVKIDAEGSELEVLEGMPRILATEHLDLVVEWSPEALALAGHGPLVLPERLLAAGLTLELVAECPGPQSFEEAMEAVDAGRLADGWYANLHAWRGGAR